MNNRESFWATQKSNQDINRQIEEDIIEGEESEDEEYVREAHDSTFSFEPTRNLAENKELIHDIYKWYKEAMQRRDREPLHEGNFRSHFFEESDFEETFMYGNEEKGYILGITKAGIFIPSHFAPKTMRGGYELMKELGEGAIPCVMGITPDLVKSIEKLPVWHKYDYEFLGSFRFSTVLKQVVYNDYPGIIDMLPSLVEEYMNDSNKRNRNYDYDDDDIEDSTVWNDGFEDAA